MEKATADRPRQTCAVLVPLSRQSPGVVVLRQDGSPDDLYFVAELSCDVDNARQFEFVGYRLKDAGHEGAARRYSVLAFRRGTADEEIRGICDCAGGTYHREPCRHVRVAVVLWQLGKL